MGEQQDRNKALVLEILDEVFHAGDGAAVERYYAADFRYHDSGAPQVTDRTGLAALATGLAAAFTDLRFTVRDLVAEGDRVVKSYLFEGTHTGDFGGLPASGVRVSVEGMEIYTFRDGLVVEARNLGDQLSFLQQVGIIPVPEAAAAP